MSRVLWPALGDPFAWQPVIPASISSTGTTATLDADTGIITCPYGVTRLRVNGVFEAGWEHLLIGEDLYAGTLFGISLQFSTSGPPVTASTGANYYTSRKGSANTANDDSVLAASTAGWIGVLGANSGQLGDLRMQIRHAAEARVTHYEGPFHSGGNAYQGSVHGSHLLGTAYDGHQITLNDSIPFAGKFRTLRRPALL